MTIEKVLKLGQTSDLLMSYLPDDPLSHVDRRFLFEIVNTLDPNFFQGAIEEVEMRRITRRVPNEVAAVVIIHEMLEIFLKISAFNLKNSNGRGWQHSRWVRGSAKDLSIRTSLLSQL